MGEFTFTAEDVVAQVRNLAAERPGYVYSPGEYESCSYVTGEDGQGCIIGQAVQRLGVPAELLEALEDKAAGGLGVKSLLSTLLGDEEAFSPAGSWLASVQARQDASAPWGAAVATTDTYLDPKYDVEVLP